MYGDESHLAILFTAHLPIPGLNIQGHNVLCLSNENYPNGPEKTGTVVTWRRLNRISDDGKITFYLYMHVVYIPAKKVLWVVVPGSKHPLSYQ